MKFDKETIEGALMGILLMENDYMELGQLYVWMHTDNRVDITMPRLLKTITSFMNKGYLVWAFVDDGSEVAFKLSEKGFAEAVIRVQSGIAWLPENYDAPAGVKDAKDAEDVKALSDKFCAGVVSSYDEDADEDAGGDFSDFYDFADSFRDYMDDEEKREGDGVRYLPHDESDEFAGEQEPSDEDSLSQGIPNKKPADEPEGHTQHCAYCGSKNDLRDNFCRVCGKKMDCRSRFLVECQRRQEEQQQRDALNTVDMLYNMLKDFHMLD